MEDAIKTVTKSRDRFSKRDQLRANRVRRLQHVASFPSDEILKYLVTNSIKNNPITVRDIKMCVDMLGKSRYIAQGKSIAKSSTLVEVHSQTVELLSEILTYYGDMQLAVDVMHVNDVPFLVSISNHLYYGIAKVVDNMKAITLEDRLRSVIKSYTVRGFNVGVIFLDI